MILNKPNRKVLLQAARGDIEVDLLITNTQLLNVITGEIYPAHIYIHEGFIVHVEDKDLETIKPAKIIHDAKQQFAIPGLIDAHVHIESSMMTPRNFAHATIPWGTTTVVTDPHEIANVAGIEGVEYMHDTASGLPQRQLIDIPSCVPSVPDLEFAGASFEATQIRELAKLDRVVGLAEVMDFPAVIHGGQRMMDIIDVAEKEGLYIQGHAPFISGRDLSAYVIGGPKTCHESRSKEEGIEKMRAGMWVDARNSSISHDVAAVWEGIKHVRYLDHLCLCTDDRESDDIITKGHMNDVVNIAIKAGMHPIDAIRSATYNTAREIKIDNLGAIAPGYIADILLVPKLEKIVPQAVFYEGKLVAQDRKLTQEFKTTTDHNLETRNTMNLKELTIEDFILKAPIENGSVKVNVMKYLSELSSSTELEVIEIPVKNGKFDLSFDPTLKFVAVVNRHHHPDNIGLHIVKNFGTTHGALASTVSHDSHNLTIVFDTPENALVAANALKISGGGMCAVEDEKILHTLALEVGGLMSTKDAYELAKDAALMKDANKQLGLIALENPLLRIVTLALIVIPKYKMSDLGFVDVLNQKLVSLSDS